MEPKKAFSRIGLAIVAYTVTTVVLVAVIVFLIRGLAPSLLRNSSFSWGINAVLQYGPAVLVFRLVLWGMPVYRYEKKRICKIDFLGALGLMSLVATAGSYLGTWMTDLTEQITGVEIYDTIDSVADGGMDLIMIACLTLFAPVIEELLFRKWIIDRIRPYGEGLAVVFSGVVFGLFHGNFTQLFYATGLGMILAYVYLRTQKIRYNIMLHMLFNVLFGLVPQVLMYVYPELNDQLMPDASHPLALLFLMAWMLLRLCLLVFGVVYLCTNRRRLTLYSNVYAVPKGRRFAVVCGNVGMILFLISTVVSFAMNVITPLFEAYLSEIG